MKTIQMTMEVIIELNKNLAYLMELLILEEGRRQTYAPGLRSITYCKYADILLENGKKDEVINKIWPLIKHDLEW